MCQMGKRWSGSAQHTCLKACHYVVPACVCVCLYVLQQMDFDDSVEGLTGPKLSETATSTLDLKAYKSKSMQKARINACVLLFLLLVVCLRVL